MKSEERKGATMSNVKTKRKNLCTCASKGLTSDSLFFLCFTLFELELLFLSTCCFFKCGWLLLVAVLC